MHKSKNFTLVELIIVLVAIAIIAAIVILNISDIRGDATLSAVHSNTKNIQTAVDMYALDNNGGYPTVTQPTPFIPSRINFNLLHPNYLRDFPKIDGLNYWVDFNGKVWVSTIDSPNNLEYNENSISWGNTEGAKEYRIFEVQNVDDKRIEWRFVGGTIDTKFPIEDGKLYLINSVDKLGLESVPAGLGYTGFPANNSSKKPTAVISMNPSSGITINTAVEWGYEDSIHPDGLNIVDVEWENKQNTYAEGVHTVRLRVMDEEEVWSEWVEKTFYSYPNTVKQISAGEIHSLVLLENGDVYSFGWGHHGQLGHGDTSNQLTPKKITALSNVKQISAGYTHSLVLLENGDVYSFGSGFDGQLGHGNTSRQFTPKRITALSNVKQISAGNYSLVLLENGDVYSFGSGAYGQLGHGDTNNQLTPKRITALSNIRQISAGREYSLVLLENGDVYSFGNGATGQLGHGDTNNQLTPKRITALSNIRQISAGVTHSLVLLENGDVYSFGWGIYGKLGYGTLDTQNTPRRIVELSNAKQISVGNDHSLVLLENGDVYSFGFGRLIGLLGHGDSSDHTTPKRIEALSGD